MIAYCESAEKEKERIKQYGVFLDKWGQPGNDAGQFRNPAHVAVNSNKALSSTAFPLVLPTCLSPTTETAILKMKSYVQNGKYQDTVRRTNIGISNDLSLDKWFNKLKNAISHVCS